MKTREDPEPHEKSVKSSEDLMNLKRGSFAGKHEAAAKEKVEETERQHTTMTKRKEKK